MVYIAGEASKCGRLGVCCRWRSFCQEMSRYTMELIMDKWVKPSVDISKWEFYDLSCKDPMDFPCGFYGGGTASGRLFCSQRVLSCRKEMPPTIRCSRTEVEGRGL